MEGEYDVFVQGTVFLDIVLTGLPSTPATGTEVFAEGMGSCPGGVANLAIAVDPLRIVVGGGLVGSWDRIAPELRRALDAAVPFPPELTVARFPSDAPLVGALALGVEAAGAVLGEEAFA